MRNFKLLDQAHVDSETGIIYLETQVETDGSPVMALRREGSYIVISASFGPLEVALRPRFDEFTRVLTRLQPVDGLNTTRQIGTGEAFLALGLKPDGVLLIRPTLVADATGHLAMNIALTDEARRSLFSWLEIEPAEPVLNR